MLTAAGEGPSEVPVIGVLTEVATPFSLRQVLERALDRGDVACVTQLAIAAGDIDVPLECGTLIMMSNVHRYITIRVSSHCRNALSGRSHWYGGLNIARLRFFHRSFRPGGSIVEHGRLCQSG